MLAKVLVPREDEPAPLARNYLGLGVVLGILSLSRENSLAWAGVVVVALWTAQSAATMSGRARNVGLFLLGLVVALAPAAIRNRVVGGEWHLTTSQFGTNFYIGNNSDADGMYRSLIAGRGQAKYEREDAVALAEREVGRKLTPREVSQYWFARSKIWMREHPADFLRLLGRKTRLTFNNVEIGDTEDQYAFAEASSELRRLTQLLPFGLIAALAAVGIFATRGRTRELWVLYALATVYAASVIAFYVFSRYRFPLVVLMLPSAAAGVIALFDGVRRRDLRSLGQYGAVGVVIGLVAFWPVKEAWPAKFAATSHYNFAVSWVEQNRLSEAESAYRRAVALRPEYAVAWNNLGELLHRLKRDDEALAAYDQALKQNERFATAMSNRGVIFLERGDEPAAERDFRAAIAADSDFAYAWLNLGNLAARRGRHAEAVEHYRRVLQLLPNDSAARINLGSVLQNVGRLDEAEAVLREAARSASNRSEPHHNLGNVLAELRKDDEAADQYRRALELAPTSFETWISLAQLEIRRGRHTEAATALDAAARFVDGDSQRADRIARLRTLLIRLDVQPPQSPK
ncbi:MAG: tetratricopeptide repeat protein [Pirellulales bacterium]